MFYIGFFILKNDWFAHSLIYGERCERIAQVNHQKWANEWFACFLSESLIFFAKNDGFAQKTDERILSPESSTFFCIPTVQRTLISYDSYDISRLDISSHPDGMDIHAFASMFKEYQELLLTTSSQSYCHLGNCGSDVGQEYDVDRYDVHLGPDRWTRIHTVRVSY